MCTFFITCYFFHEDYVNYVVKPVQGFASSVPPSVLISQREILCVPFCASVIFYENYAHYVVYLIRVLFLSAY